MNATQVELTQPGFHRTIAPHSTDSRVVCGYRSKVQLRRTTLEHVTTTKRWLLVVIVWLGCRWNQPLTNHFLLVA